MRLHLMLLSVVILLLASVLPALSQDGESPFAEDTLNVGTSTGGGDNQRISVALSRATFPGAAEQVVIGRDDVFADSLASGVLQATSPLLLVPQSGPVPPEVLDEIARLEAGTAVILGGAAAISQTVVDELQAAGLETERRAGPSRIETAIDVAATDAPAADTAVLARAGGPEGNPTAGFADTLAAGGWAAENGWPILLTQTDVLTASTREYLDGSSIRTINVLGGSVAISEAVTDELTEMGITVQRISGPDRAATAIEVAKSRGADTAADVASVIVVDGFGEQAWAAGFAAAARSAALDAPIVLANDAADSLPPATTDWLVEGPQTVTCASSNQLCDSARVQLGFDPVVRVPIPAGSVTYTVADAQSSAVMASTFDGQPVGLAWPCATDGCTQIDWTDDGSWLAILDSGQRSFAVTGETLGAERALVLLGDGDTLRTIDAYTEDSGGQIVGTVIQRADGTFNEITTRVSEAGQSGSGGAAGTYASFQALDNHPHSDGNGLTSGLLIEPNGDLFARTGSFEFDLGIDRRNGAQMTGAGWNPDGSGHIAVVDQIGGVGLLRTLAWQGDQIVEATDLDVTNVPHWTPGGQVAVLADTGDAIAIAVVDPSDGSSEIILDDAGDADGMRLTSDASGTFFAWRTGADVRVLDTRDGSVSVITPPDGKQITGGPAFRP